MGGLRARPGQFSLFRRGKIWYYWTYDQYGQRHRLSTGCTKKSEAFEFCMARRDNSALLVFAPEKKKHVTLEEFGKDFWNYESCPIIRNKLLRGGHYSVRMAGNNQASFEQHVAPFLGSVCLDELTSSMIEEWILNLPTRHKISNKTSNNAFLVLRQMLDWAVKEDMIQKNPAHGVKPLIKSTVRRAAFTREQIRALFSEPWENDLAYTACFLASRTGMRMGEVRALTSAQIHPDFIEVNAAWAEKEGRKTTKSGHGRIVPINGEIYSLLKKYAPPLGGLLFTLNGVKPVKEDYIRDRLRKRMEELEIDYKTENLSFHSFRHFFNTRLVAGNISGEKIRAVIGHESEAMTEHYAHLSDKDLQEIKNLQAAI